MKNPLKSVTNGTLQMTHIDFSLKLQGKVTNNPPKKKCHTPKKSVTPPESHKQLL